MDLTGAEDQPRRARNQVTMAKLRQALSEAGFAEVRTYLQSGNVIATSEHDNPGLGRR